MFIDFHSDAYLSKYINIFTFSFKWHALNKEEQQKYYEMARKEREKHMVLYPGWSARDNYGKRKKSKERISYYSKNYINKKIYILTF